MVAQTQDSAPNLKYGLLLLPTRAPIHDRRTRAVDTATTTAVKSLSDLFANRTLGDWQQWFGVKGWSRFPDEMRVVITTMPTRRPKVIDAEDTELGARMQLFITALNLVSAPGRPWGAPYIMTGIAHSADRLVDSHTHIDYRRRPTPSYEQYPAYFEARSGDWLTEWADAALRLQRTTRMPALIALGLKALEHAIDEADLEFRIPELIRAAETVLALPKGGNESGARGFAARAASIAPALATDRFLGGENLNDVLQELYRHRNDCVHGKLPFATMAAAGGDARLRLARLEFVAEEIARHALLVGMEAPAHFDTREAAESAWDARRFPPARS